jgi:hypothetical protein
MAKSNKTLKAVQRFFTRIYHVLKPLALKLWAGILYIWNRPLLVGGILLIAAIFLFNLIVQQTFKPYTNCAYLIGTKLSMPSFFCEGYDVRAFGASIFKIPGLGGVMDPPLEFVRKLIAWSVLLFFAVLSTYLTYILNNLKTVVKLLTFNKEQWKSFMANLRIWLFIFVTLCLLFYFSVMR